MNKILKTSLQIFAVLMVALLFVGCGAQVNTNMSVDGSFSGERVITLNIDDSDLNSVSGGFSALTTVAQKTCPKALTLSYDESASPKTITFTLAFTSLEDYLTKVTALYNLAYSEEEMTGDSYEAPVVTFEKADTIFKSGLKFQENFESYELLRWYEKALLTAGIINEDDPSNWHENGSHLFTIDGEEYSNYSEFDISSQNNTCVDNVVVTTGIDIDGTITREIKFEFSESGYTAITDKEVDVQAYFKDLAGKDATYAYANNSDDYYSHVITLTYNSKDAKEIVSITNKILQSDTNALEVVAKPKDDVPGVAEVFVTESLDASYYVDDNNNVDSYIRTYNNATVISTICDDAPFDYYTEGDAVYYTPQPGFSYQFGYEWKIEFSQIEFSITASDIESVEAELTLTLPEKLDDTIKESAKNVIKSSSDKGGEYSEKDNQCTISFSGKIDDVTKEVNGVIGSNDKEGNTEDNTQYFDITLEEFTTESAFTTGVKGTLYYDFTPIIGNSDLSIKDIGDILYHGDVSVDEEGTKIASSSGVITFYNTQTSIIVIVLVSVFAIIAILGIVFVVLNAKSGKEFIDTISEKVKAKQEAKAAEPVEIAPKPETEPNQQVEEIAPAAEPECCVPQTDEEPAPVEETADETDSEEEFI